ncbi:MAG: DNA polymerase Y family protein, partial [Pseudomonadota bacterium]
AGASGAAASPVGAARAAKPPTPEGAGSWSRAGPGAPATLAPAAAAGARGDGEMRRVISVWAPRLAAERALRARRRFCAAPSGGWGPFAVVAEEKGALRLAAVDQAAQAAGLARGMGLADARAIRPDLLTAPADPEGDRAFLVGLARWAGRYSPWVGIDGPEALSIDVTGCAHLFGGEAALLADLAARLTAFGLTARLGLADSRSGAWALAWAQEMRRGEQTRAEAGGGAAAVRAPEAAWSGAPGAIAPPGGSAAALAALPIGALRLTPAETAGLERLGLRRIGELLAQPRGPLARRFGAGLLRRLDQALAAEPDPIAPLGPAPIFAVRLSAPEPLMRREDVRRGLERLLARLCARLEDAGRGARGFELALRRADGGTMRAEIGLARPGRDPARIAPLFDAALERMTAAFGIDALRLEARAVEPLTQRQSHAGPAFRAGSGGGGAAGAGLEGDALDALLTRLGGRLGFDRAVGRVVGLPGPEPLGGGHEHPAVVAAHARLDAGAGHRDLRAVLEPPHEPFASEGDDVVLA